MLDTAVTICIMAMALSVLCSLIRLGLGPTVMDRILAFDSIAVSIVGLVVTLSIKWRSSDYMDIILLFTILGFFGTAAFSLFLHRAYKPHADRGSGPEEGGGND